MYVSSITGIPGISPSLHRRGSVINTSVTLSALCHGSVPPRETTRTTTTNNNKLDHYEVCRALSVPTYPRPAFPTLSPDHLQLSCRFIALTISILLAVRSLDESFLPFYVILQRWNIWNNYRSEKTYNKMLWLNINFKLAVSRLYTGIFIVIIEHTIAM